jgi:hypothetical protein
MFVFCFRSAANLQQIAWIVPAEKPEIRLAESSDLLAFAFEKQVTPFQLRKMSYSFI